MCVCVGGGDLKLGKNKYQAVKLHYILNVTLNGDKVHTLETCC